MLVKDARKDNLKFLFTEEAYFTNEQIDLIMELALEEGILYWADKAKPVNEFKGAFASEQISRDGELVIHDFRADDYIVLDKEKFTKGLQHMVNIRYLSPRFNYKGKFYEIVLDGLDKNMADAIIQYSLFHEVKYDRVMFEEESEYENNNR